MNISMVPRASERVEMCYYLRSALALHFAWYNFCRIHSALRVTPAMQAGISDHVWEIGELVGCAHAEQVAHRAA